MPLTYENRDFTINHAITVTVKQSIKWEKNE